ncbi:class I SAM-dependent methyltransferase [Priestia endophytica]|jgi:ubiquinone/menaquinone biosynthesis C-methylase UbiE|uniref:SAM-dependent methyltransferase n=2 Tax=Priestia endophytica TaxID=135735 RepID=A0AAX1Q2M4_9BACI|nr:class I SAM-dependent methyltransferase [Priestia endophytica]KAB2496021.1 class I SAM-dependent methyltransferase [Priestia endophytica]KYG31592.1 methyltransferase [Priestia endophytica]MBG9811546.1 methyltransferase [Priestia endophytica]MCM3537037.1 class I SAM-dependent methyltransferase [Priestia endophytica]RAS71944.1 SAM-dependent methyltransferase [Priestia endophytica]
MEKQFKWHETSKEKWDNQANTWNSKSKEMWETGSRSIVIPTIEKFAQKGEKYLDVGCGDGFGSSLLHSKNINVTGVDLSSKMIEKAEELFGQEGLKFVQGDFASLPFGDEEFDGAMVINALEWTETPLSSLQELKRVVKKGGKAFVAILGPTAGPRSNSYERLYGKDVICNTMMPWEFERMSSENGWYVLDGYPVYKTGVQKNEADKLSRPLQQALSFFWLFVLEKKKEQ